MLPASSRQGEGVRSTGTVWRTLKRHAMAIELTVQDDFACASCAVALGNDAI